MARKKRDLLDRLTPDERSRVLRTLIEDDPDVRAKAEEIAKGILEDVSIESVARDVVDLVGGLSIEDLHARAGRRSFGYVEPGEAAWELLDASIADLRSEMEQLCAPGTRPAAEVMYQGILAGLYELREGGSNEVLEYAPDFPAETAAWTLDKLLDLYPPSQRRAAGRRILRGAADVAEDWVDMLEREVERATAPKRAGKRPANG